MESEKAQEWGHRVAVYVSNPYFCNVSTSCSLVFEENPACPIPTNIHQEGCDPPCHTGACRFIYRMETECPRLVCTALSKTDFGLVIGLLLTVVLISFCCTCCICYFKCNVTFRRMNNSICSCFHTLRRKIRRNRRSGLLRGETNSSMTPDEESSSWTRTIAAGLGRSRSFSGASNRPIIRPSSSQPRLTTRSLERIYEHEPLRADFVTGQGAPETPEEGAEACENDTYVDPSNSVYTDV